MSSLSTLFLYALYVGLSSVFVFSILFMLLTYNMVKTYNSKYASKGKEMSLLEALRSRDGFFAALWTSEQARLYAMTRARRRMLYNLIPDGCSLLELGPGFGTNFSYFTKARSVAVVEPNSHMHDALRAEAVRHSLRDFQLFESEAEAEASLGPASLECIVSAFVLCSVDDPAGTVQFCNRLLKKDGLFLALEHSAAAPGTLENRIQRVIQPCWGSVSGNCRLTRDIDAALRSAPNFAARAVELWKIPVPLLGRGVQGLLCK